MLPFCPYVHLINMVLPFMVFVTFPLNAAVDARYGKSFEKEYKSRYKAFFIICFFEAIIYILGYAAGLLLGVCL